MEIFKEIKTLVSHNVAFKASAFLLALMVWFYFFAEREGISFKLGRTESVEVRVLVLGEPDSIHRAVVRPGKIELTVRGAREALGETGPGDFNAFVETTGLPAGVYTLPVRVSAPAALEVVSRNPAHVTVTVH